MAKPTKKNFKDAVREHAPGYKSFGPKTTKTSGEAELTLDLIEVFAHVGLVLKNVKEMAKALADRGWVKSKGLN